MKRKALIIYMTNSPSGKLIGPIYDYNNMHGFLTSNLGGDWYDHEIDALENPTTIQVREIISQMNGCDYAFVVFSGHGEFEKDTKLQYVELMDGDISIRELIVKCKRQAIIIDACRGYFSKLEKLREKNIYFSRSSESINRNISTRELFDNKLSKTEEGLTILYAASENQSALDTSIGAAYISSLLSAAEEWENSSNNLTELTLKSAHEKAVKYMNNNFVTTQVPVMNTEKRLRYYPFAVKFSILYG